MYIDNQSYKAKIGIVNLDVKGSSIRVRFTYPKGKRQEFNTGKFSEINWQSAIRTAQLIDRDISIGDFDTSLVRYRPKLAKALEIANKKPNLVDLWNSYKETSQNRVAATTIKQHWTQYEKHYLNKTPNELLEIDKASEFVAYLLTRYSAGSISPIFSNCLNPSVNLAVKTGKLDRNPYKAIPLGSKTRKQIEAYEPNEVKMILGAFYSDDYVKKGSVYPHSFYAPMVEFLALVGCRPSECHALTWSDIKTKNDRTYIKFSKSYNNGILLQHTKTYEIRVFPVNEQLESLLGSLPRIPNNNNLIFPSVNLGYVNQKMFNRRYWNTVIKGLITDGKLTKAFRSYTLRHSFITRLVREGIDIATVARLSGNSTETIMRHYLAAKDSYVIPTL